MTKYISCSDTAKLVRQALKESFPGVKFGVRSSTYSGGASMSVSWIDGPNVAQVEAVTNGYQGSYFDGSIDYKGSVYHMLDGERVSFGADSIHCSREYSDATIQAAIDRIYRRYFESGADKPTVADYKKGALYRVTLPSHFDDVQRLISSCLYKHSDRLKVEKSPTAARSFVTHDDGYSRQCGAGMSAVCPDAH